MSLFGSLFAPKKIVDSRWTTPEMKELETEFDETEKLYLAILPAIKGMHQSQSTNVKKLNEFSAAMSKHGSREKHPLSKVFEKCSEAHSSLAEVQSAFLLRYKESVVDPVVHFIEKDIKDVKAKRKTFISEVSKYDQKVHNVTRLEGAPDKAAKLTAAKEELVAQEAKCEELKAELIGLYAEIVSKKRAQLTTLMRELGMIQLEHLDSSQQALGKPHQEIESLCVDVLSDASVRNTPGAAEAKVAQAQVHTEGVVNPFLQDDEELTPRSDEEQ